MSSINTNIGAMSALSQLRSINDSMMTTQDRISSGLKITSAKDNAAYFQISETMKGDGGALSSINEGLTLTKNSIATARLGAESFKDLAIQFQDRVAFAQGAQGGMPEIENELGEIVKQMKATIVQSTFNGDDIVRADQLGATPTTAASVDAATGALTSAVLDTTDYTADRDVVTGVSRSGDFAAITTKIDKVDLATLVANFEAYATGFAAAASDDVDGATYLKMALETVEGLSGEAVDAATTLGLAENTIESQQSFLKKLTDNIASGVGSMVDANMEEEAARLKAVQTQQQLATQALTIANNQPQQLLALFR